MVKADSFRVGTSSPTIDEMGARIKALNAQVAQGLEAGADLNATRSAQNWINAAETSLERIEHPGRRTRPQDIEHEIRKLSEYCHKAEVALAK
jgi:hypothetical protein